MASVDSRVTTADYAVAPSVAPELGLSYTPPSTAEQLSWAPDRSCPAPSSYPLAPTMAPSAARRRATRPPTAPRAERSSRRCVPSLRLEAAAASGDQPCALMVNGVDLFTSCGLGRLARSVGVCAALVDAPNPPRAACFDTTAPGAGVEGLATRIDDAPLGAPILLASCSRLAWQQDLDRVAAALGAIGTNSTPTNIDDAYAVVGVKGGAAPLAEAIQPCCDRAATPICHTCRTDALDRTATADVACGVAALERHVDPRRRAVPWRVGLAAARCRRR